MVCGESVYLDTNHVSILPPITLQRLNIWYNGPVFFSSYDIFQDQCNTFKGQWYTNSFLFIGPRKSQDRFKTTFWDKVQTGSSRGLCLGLGLCLILVKEIKMGTHGLNIGFIKCGVKKEPNIFIERGGGPVTFAYILSLFRLHFCLIFSKTGM